MENFITGYAGHEHQVRKELKKVLGEEKYEYFFDKVCGAVLSRPSDRDRLHSHGPV